MGVFKKSYIALLVIVSACSTSGGDKGLKFDLARQTAGPVTLASFEELCGTPKGKIDRYVESYITFAKGRGPISATEEERMRKMFADGRSGIHNRFPTRQSVTEQCTKYPPNPAVLDRGIAGDFSGQI